MEFDLAILGGGNLSRYLVSQSAFFNLKCLIVSDQDLNLSNNHIRYRTFIDSSDNLKINKLIINSRFDRFDDQVAESILDFLKLHGNKLFRRVYYTSSVAVYPNKGIKMNESCTDAVTEYGSSKLRLENKLFHYFPDRFIGLRVSNLYGGPFLSNLETAIRNAIKSDEVVEIPLADVSRDFLFAQDLVRFLFSNADGSLEPGNYNFATGTSTLLEEFIANYSRNQVQVLKILPLPEIQFSNIDNSKIIKAMNIEFTAIEDGIEKARLFEY